MGYRSFAGLIALALAVPGLSAPALAAPDPLMDLDALSRASDGLATGMALARRQIASGELLGALATLERVLTAHPEADQALLLYASVTCRVDDRSGALISFEQVSSDAVSSRAMNEATAPCTAQEKGK